MPSYKTFNKTSINQETAEKLAWTLNRRGYTIGSSFKEMLETANTLRKTCPKTINKVDPMSELSLVLFCLEWVMALNKKGWNFSDVVAENRSFFNAVKNSVFELNR